VQHRASRLTVELETQILQYNIMKVAQHISQMTTITILRIALLFVSEKGSKCPERVRQTVRII